MLKKYDSLLSDKFVSYDVKLYSFEFKNVEKYNFGSMLLLISYAIIRNQTEKLYLHKIFSSDRKKVTDHFLNQRQKFYKTSFF